VDDVRLDKFKIEILVRKRAEWGQNMSLAVEKGVANPLSNAQQPLKDKYKRYFSAAIVLYKDGTKAHCFLPGKVRLTGDFLDHIDPNRWIASLKVELKRGAIFGARDLKLFLPASRYGEGEVIVSQLAEELGLLAPRTLVTNVSFNGDLPAKMLFQEDLNSDFLQRLGRREGPILEPNEYFKIGEGRQADFDIRNSFALVSNGDFLGKGKNYRRAAMYGISELNFAILEHQWDMREKNKCCVNSYGDTFDNRYLATADIRSLQKFIMHDTLLKLASAYHGLVPSNRKFYYDPLRKLIEPIVYDSNARVKELKKPKIENILRDPQAYQAAKEIALISTDKLTRSLAKAGVSAEGVTRAKTFIQQIRMSTEDQVDIPAGLTYPGQKIPQFVKTSIGRYKDYSSERFVYVSLDSNSYRECDANNLRCETGSLDFLLESNMLWNLNEAKSHTHLIGVFHRDGDIISRMEEVQPRQYLEKGIRIMAYGESKVIIDVLSRKIILTGLSPDNAVVIRNSDLTDWTIEAAGILSPDGRRSAFGMSSRDDAYDRIDENGLTGCLTIIDSVLSATTLRIKDADCEDAINLFQSNGHIASIRTRSSASDAIDVDMSSLTIDDVHVANAGNDCLDFSGSEVEIMNGHLSKCSDKGISVGEHDPPPLTGPV